MNKWLVAGCRLIVFCVVSVSMVVSSNDVRAQDSVHQVSVKAAEGVIDLADYRGKILYVDFWASWCVPCLKSFPWMNAMHEKYAARGLQIVAVNLDKDPALSAGFIDKTKPAFAIGYDQQGELATLFNVVGMPNSFLFDAEGLLISSHVGFRQKDRQRYEAALVNALDALPGK